MNFEIIDNAYQVTVLFICMLLSAWLGIRKKNLGFIMLSFGYGCFMMGTLFFVLYLAILGRVPQIFYTCEISWLAAYLFFLSLLLLRKESEPLSFSAIALIPAVIVAVVVLLFKIFGPAFLPCIACAITLGAITYLASCRILRNRKNGRRTSWLDHCFLLCVFLQLGVYIVSIFMTDYQHFNLYFAIDMLLTAMLAALLPFLYREVLHDLH